MPGTSFFIASTCTFHPRSRHRQGMAEQAHARQHNALHVHALYTNTTGHCAAPRRAVRALSRSKTGQNERCCMCGSHMFTHVAGTTLSPTMPGCPFARLAPACPSECAAALASLARRI
eukprot:366073-Chlamydomonas_euryale.AAC.1